MKCTANRRGFDGLSLAQQLYYAALNVCMSVRCDGNGKNVSYSLCRIDVRGDYEQLLWTLCKPSQQEQGIGAIPVASCRFPNLLAVEDEFSPNTLKMCFAELLQGEEKIQNAYAIREAAIKKSRERIEELKRDIAKSVVEGEVDKSELPYLDTRIKEIEAKIEQSIQATSSLDPETLRKAYRLVSYDIDLEALVGVLPLARERVRYALDQELKKIDQSNRINLVAPQRDDESGEIKQAINTTYKYLLCNWRMEDLIKMNIAQKKPYNEEVYYRYDHPARVHTVKRTLPQFDIYRPWRVFLRYSDVLADIDSRISSSSFEKLMAEYESTQKSLRQCLAYAILRLSRRKLNKIVKSPISAKAKTLYSRLLVLDLQNSPPSEEFQAETSALVRQEDAAKDFTDEVAVKKTKREQELEEQEAERNS